MAFGMMVYRGHLISPTDHKHPETGKPLYSISELKPPLTPPLLTSQKACVAYIKEVDPWDIGERVNAYGQKRKNWRPPHSSRNYTGQRMEEYYGRTCTGYET